MGYELAREAYELGAEVILISGPVELEPPPEIHVERVVTAEEMRQAVLKNYNRADIVIMAAAVADFRFSQSLSDKVRKDEIGHNFSVEMTRDILKELGASKTKQLLAGFAAETSQVGDRAGEKMKQKNLDLMVANDVTQPETGFGSDENEVWLLWPDGRSKKILRMSKRKISQQIFSEIEVLLNERQRHG
jgi:phosphopantothenoylcysteine decarboxylase/phosphopantothenate--cysteine ligase